MRVRLFTMLALLLGACGADPSTGLNEEALVITSRCSVSGAGTMPDGAALAGDARDDGSGPTGWWTHDGVDATPTALVCRINGRRIADVRGTATVDGTPGYTFALHVQDRGSPGEPTRVPGPAESLSIEATLTYCPSQWTDGTATFENGALVAVPDSLPVIVGNGGNQWTFVTFVDHDDATPIRCAYRGGAAHANPTTPDDVAAGEAYLWARCERSVCGASGCSYELDPAITPGSVLDVDSIEVHVQHGSTRFPSRDAAQTTVALEIDVTPFVLRTPEADYYHLTVYAPDGSIALDSDGDLASGDLVVSPL